MIEHVTNSHHLAPSARHKSLLAAVLERPGHAVSVALALARGHWQRLWFRLTGVRFRAGRNLRLFAAITVRGPGEVVLGDDVTVLESPTFTTHEREARIVVGDGTVMGAATFGCAKEIRIGSRCIVARAHFLDTDFHSTRADRWSPDAPVRVAPVRIGDNVWISQHAAILPGTSIGENSVVSFGAVVMRSFPENVIIVGNPAKVAAPVQQCPAEDSSTQRPAPAAAEFAAAESMSTSFFGGQAGGTRLAAR
jgi:carbonic anhydrase/acetyltransferase-like protein (isoleucine patch superfamily)